MERERDRALLLDADPGQLRAGTRREGRHRVLPPGRTDPRVDERGGARTLALEPVLTDEVRARHRHRPTQEGDGSAAHHDDGPHRADEPTERGDRLRERRGGRRVVDDRRERPVEVDDERHVGRERGERTEGGAGAAPAQAPRTTRQFARSAPAGTGVGIGAPLAAGPTIVATVAHSRV